MPESARSAALWTGCTLCATSPLWSAVSATTTVELSTDWFRSGLAMVAPIASVMVAALFVLQVIKHRRGRGTGAHDAEWQILMLRCPSRSFTIVGDRAQARHGLTESWPERLKRIGLDQISLASLSINYRTPREIMAEAEPVIRAVLPDANVPTSIRISDLPVLHGSTSDLGSILDTWLAGHADGIVCVIDVPGFRATSRVRPLSPELAKGLEFDLVLLIDPEAFGTGTEGAVDRYVAMTRATQRLAILTSS
jgi:hypothetical protein